MPIRKRSWFIAVVLVSVLLIGGITGGVIAAADSNSGATAAQNQTTNRLQDLLGRACAIYQENTGVAINSDQLKEALDQAQSELREEALQSRLQNLVENGNITQEEADNYLQWWQSRPDIKAPLPGLGRRGPGGGMMWESGFGPWGGRCPGSWCFGRSGQWVNQ